MKLTKAFYWEMLSLLYRNGTKIKDLQEAVDKWGIDTVKLNLQQLKRASQRRLSQNVYGVDGASAWVEAMRSLKTDSPNRPALPQPVQGLNQKTKRNLASWLKHTQNINKVQGMELPKCRRGRISSSLSHKDHGQLLSKVMLFLSQKEKHPAPSSSKDPDYSDIYRYLSQVLAGDEPMQLSPGSAAKVLEMVKRVQKVARNIKNNKKLRYHIATHLKATLRPWKKTRKVAASNPSTSKEGKSSNVEECPLFDDMDNEEELAELTEKLRGLPEYDPQYQMMEERLQAMHKQQQLVASSNLSNVPGLNPYVLPPDMLFKPKETNP